MDLNLAGSSALVTGASRGIGRAIAEGLAAEGCHLHLAARDLSLLQEVRAGIQARHAVEVACHAMDLAEDTAALAERCRDVDILVNNAGSIPQGDLLSIDSAGWRRAWDLKVFGYITLTRQMYARMRERRRGVIANIIGLAAERPMPKYIAGTSGNAALMAFTKALGSESVDYGVRVVGVNPGPIETDRQRIRLEARAQSVHGDPSRWREFIGNAPMGRLGRPQEVADLVTFLVSERASYISGAVIPVDAGRLARNDTA